MVKIVRFQKKSELEKAAEALRVLEDAYAYYTPDETVVTATEGEARSPLDQMYQYYAA
ncbi:MAG: hypothetical protein IE922_04145 [Sphingomonadales bacterium]|nr:hypothetical protein [Sphingomonadales bacterium]